MRAFPDPSLTQRNRPCRAFEKEHASFCYRTEEPDTLVARQAHAFDPVLRWAAEQLGAPRSTVSAGVTHVAQPIAALAAIGAALDGYDDPLRSPFSA